MVIGCVLLLAVPVFLQSRAHTGLSRPIAIAGVRAVVQLTLVALIIAAAVARLWASLLVIAAMFVMAVLTSSKRIGVERAVAPYAAVSMAAGVIPVIALTTLSGTIPFRGIALVPIAGTVMNNIMSGHTLFGRTAFRALSEHHETFEGYLALGLPPHTAAAELLHPRIQEALIPSIDSVKTSGIVTLPGAFLGVMLGGGSPTQAAMAQVIVLLGILCAQTCTVLTQYALVTRGLLVPLNLRSLFGRP
ncbi:ABC transporter permease [Calidifontibacter terrae]